MDGSRASIEEFATGRVERVAPPHAKRWTGLWIGLLGAVVGIAALGPSSAGKLGDAQVSHPADDVSRAASPVYGAVPGGVALTEPLAATIETSGFVTAAGSNSGGARSLLVTVSLGDLVLGRHHIAVGPGQSFALRIPIATPIDGLALPATYTVVDESDGSVLSAVSIVVAGPPMTAWVVASTAGRTIVEGVAPAGATRITVRPVDGCKAGTSEVAARIGDPRVAFADTRAALAAFGRTAWRAILPPCDGTPTIVVRWSGVGGERGELYSTLGPLGADPAAGRPARHESRRAVS